MNVYITRINGLPLEDITQYMQNMTAGIAYQLGFKEMGIYHYPAEAESAESMGARIDGIIAGISRGDLIICQFPTGNGLRFEWTLINHLKAYGGRVAVFLQNTELLYSEENRSVLPEMVKLYNQAEVMIVPSLSIRRFLLENRIRKDMKFVIQELWDWVDGNESGCSEAYMDKMPAEIAKSGFGLVWHKNAYDNQLIGYELSYALSRFLAMGRPVIVPAGISSQMLIERNHLGMIVHSLDEASEKIRAMKESEFQEYVTCVEQFAPALRKGFYTKKCLFEAMGAFYRKDAGRLAVPPTVYRLETPKFLSAVLRESYGEALALSWSFKGDCDGFLIYNVSGTRVYGTDNVYQHYYWMKAQRTEEGFIVKAYVETLKGKLIVAESERVWLSRKAYIRPKVSLIIPVYNAEDYVARSLDTALAQSFAALEIICVDDGSIDRTPEILNWYAEKYPNVRVIRQENKGVASARNTGITVAEGEYIGFMDNDDMIHPDMVARLECSARKNDCDIAITSVYQIKKEGYEVFAQYPIEEDTAVGTEEFFDMHFTTGCMFTVVIWNKLYRASVVKSHLIPLMIADDNAWTPYILSYADKVCYLDDRSYEWDRQIRSSTQVDKWQSRSVEEIFRTHRDTIMFYLENGARQKIGRLKCLAKRQLDELRRVYKYEEYEKLWKQIEERI